MKITLPLVGLLLMAASAPGQDGAAQPAAPAAAQPAKPAEPPVYDEQADARAQIAAAVAKARKENRRVLIQWGANWCGWCKVLHATFRKERDLARELMYEYDIVYVDVGRFDKNTDLVESYGVNFKDNGIPFLTVLDAEGRVLANQPTGPLEGPMGEGKTMGYNLPAVLEFLKKHEAKPWAAQDVLAKGLAEAGQKEKVVFLHFGAPWCGWCHRLEAWMARPEVAALLAKDFVDVKIDIDRMPGGKDILAKYNVESGSGIPWFVFVTPDGSPIIDSTGPQGNTGFPYADEEIAHFMTMLKKAAPRLTEQDLAALKASLEAGRDKGQG